MKAWLKEQIKDRKQAGLLALFAVILAGGIAALCFAGSSFVCSFGRIRAAQTKAEDGLTQSKASSGKLSYEQFQSGTQMYCGYLGRLNVHAGPDSASEVLGHLVYKDPVQVFIQEQNGYVRVCSDRTDGTLEGYCLREELTEEKPSDGRLYLNVPDYKQYDPRWGGLSLGGSYETIESAGCTTTCLAMAYTYLEEQ